MDINKRYLLQAGVGFIFSKCLASSAYASKEGCGSYSRVDYVFPFGVSTPFYRISQKFVDLIHENTSCKSIVLSKTGANGLIASNYVREMANEARVLISSTSTATLNNLMAKDKNSSLLEPLGLMFKHPQVMVCRRDTAKSLGGFLKFASSRTIKFSTTGVGGVFHLLGKAYAHEFGFPAIDVPYQSNHFLPLLQGEVDFTFLNVGQAQEYFNHGSITPLLRSGGPKLEAFPNLQSIQDYFPYLGFEVTWGLMADKNLSTLVKQFISRALGNKAIFKDVELVTLAKNYGLTIPNIGDVNTYAHYLNNEKRLFMEIMNKVNLDI